MRKSSIFFAVSCFLLILACSKSSDIGSRDDTNPIDISANLLETGDSANDLLSTDQFTKLKIEIAFVNDFRPTTSAVNSLVEFIKEHTFKQDIELVFNALESPEQDSLTLQEIVQLEADNRTVFNEGETLGVYIYFADAPDDSDAAEDGKLTVGAVYRNTSMIIHESTVRNLAALSPFITTVDVETATLNHEFGHLFGLVNLGSPMVNDHEDPEARRHCNVPGCLMRAELQFNTSGSSKSSAITDDESKVACLLSGKSVLQMLEQASAKGRGIAPDLDAECILDLQANGGR